MLRGNSRTTSYLKPVSLPNLSQTLSRSRRTIMACTFSGSYLEPILIPSLSNLSKECDDQLEISIDLDTEMDMCFTSREVKIARVAKLIKGSITEARKLESKVDQVAIKLKEAERYMAKLFKGVQLILEHLE